MLKGLYIKTARFGRDAAGGSITHTFGMINGFVAAGVDLTVLSTEEIDPCVGNVIVLPVNYSKKLPPFVREYVYYRKYCKAVMKWCRQNNDHFDFVYSRHAMFCKISKEIRKLIKSFCVLEVNNTQHDSVWSLVLEPHLSGRMRVLRPLYFIAGKILGFFIGVMERPVIKAADHIIVISQPIKEKLKKKYLVREENITVMPNGVNTTVFCNNSECGKKVRLEHGISEDDVVVGFAGTFGNWHGIPELTKSILSIAKCNGLSFLLIGDGLMRKPMMETLNEKNNVHFPGIVPYSEMPAYLSACDILVASNSWDPKYKEPFFGSPTKLFEYMSMGKAIIASRLEQMNELLTDDESALMFTPGDVDEMASAILRAANDIGMRERLGNEARKLAVEKYTWKANAEEVLALVSAGKRDNAEL